MWWFTEHDGVLCIGTEPKSLATLVISTDIVADPPIQRELTQDELNILGDPYNARSEDVHNLALNVLAEG